MPTASGHLGCDRSARLAVGVLAACAAVALAALILLPGLERTRPLAGAVVRAALAPACHQLPERSFTVRGATLPLCARCTGLAAGGAAGVAVGAGVAAWRRRLRGAVLWGAVIPTALDGALALAGVSPLGNGPRALLALPAGFAVGWLLAVAVGDIVRRRDERGRVLEAGSW